MEILKITEELPETYPAVTGLSTRAAAIDAAIIWQRIEAYVAWRWSPRSVVIVFEGGGEWVPTLEPMGMPTTYSWTDGGWLEVDTDTTAIGFRLPEGRSKIEVIVGAGLAPKEIVLEAFRRLAEYVAADPVGAPGASNYSVDLGDLSESISRNPAHMSRALANSGAADLLRPYRKL